MSRQRLRAGITLTVFVIVTGLAAVGVAVFAMSMPGPESTVQEQAKAEGLAGVSTTTEPPPTTEAPTTTEPLPTSAFRDPVNKELIALRIEAGDCVALGTAPGLTKTACGTGNANYRVLDKLPDTATCPTDADRTQHQHIQGLGQANLCLDIDWVTGGCMQLTPDNPKHIDCTTHGIPDGVRVVEIKQGTTDVNTCSKGDRAIVYQQRQWLVCVARL